MRVCYSNCESLERIVVFFLAIMVGCFVTTAHLNRAYLYDNSFLMLIN